MTGPKLPPELDEALVRRYGKRPKTLAEVRATALAWEQLKSGKAVLPSSPVVDELDLEH